MKKDAKIYVAGHRGMVGSAIVRELERQGYHNLVLRTHRELDLTRQDQVEKFFEKEKPEYVLKLAKKDITTNDEEIYNYIKDQCDVYYKVYAVESNDVEVCRVETLSLAQEIVDKIKVRITLSKDYRMVCKQNGLISKDSVDVISRAWHLSKGKAKSLCNAIDFSKDLATGEIYRYRCEQFDEKYANLKSAQNVRGDIKVSYDKNKYENRKSTLKKLSDIFVSIKIPPCFVEE